MPLFHLIESAVQKFSEAKTSAITLGCGAGFTSFLLTKVFQKVVGVDYGGRFIDAGMKLQQGESLEYGTPKKVARATDFEGVDPGRVAFKQVIKVPHKLHPLFEDLEISLELQPHTHTHMHARMHTTHTHTHACTHAYHTHTHPPTDSHLPTLPPSYHTQLTWISNEIEDFDLILFEFLDRLAEPKGWLCKLWECLTPRGLAVFAASNKWDGKRIGQYIGKW